MIARSGGRRGDIATPFGHLARRVNNTAEAVQIDYCSRPVALVMSPRPETSARPGTLGSSRYISLISAGCVSPVALAQTTRLRGLVLPICRSTSLAPMLHWVISDSRRLLYGPTLLLQD